MSQAGIEAARTPTKGAIRLFLRYARRFSMDTQRQYESSLRRFSEHIPPFLDEVRAEHIDKFILSQPIKNSARNQILYAIKSFYHYLEDYHSIENVAAKVKKLTNSPPTQRVISEIEYRKILAAASEKERAVIGFIANSGLRSQETCDLRPDNVSSDQKYITITGKGSKRRQIPLNDTCRQAIPLIFSRRYTKNGLSWLCKKLSRKAGIPLFGPHALRHRFCTQLLKKGVPVPIVAKIMGHASPEITYKIYCHLTTPDTLGVTDCLD